jgi:hypothetical protein
MYRHIGITAPVIQDFMPFGISRSEIVELPHEALDQDRMIQQAIKNLPDRQPTTFQLQCRSFIVSPYSLTTIQRITIVCGHHVLGAIKSNNNNALLAFTNDF